MAVKKLKLLRSVMLILHCVDRSSISPLLFFLTVLPPIDPMSIERSNLLSMMKLSIKVLIQSSLNLGRTLDSEYPPLQQFFVVLEHCLKHGLKGDAVEADFGKQLVNI